MRQQKEMISCNNCGKQLNTANQFRDWCSLKCKEILEKRQKDSKKAPKRKRNAKESIFSEEDTRPHEEQQREISHRNYYWVLPYMKRLKLFFISDIEQALKKDDIYFSKSDISKAIKYWIDSGCVEISPTHYVHPGEPGVKKYIYVKDPE